MSVGAQERAGAAATAPASCCPRYRAAIELIGRRWTGAIVDVLLRGGPLRFSQIGHAVPAVSDRLLSERLKDLEAHGVVRRVALAGPRPHGRYELTEMGRDLAPALAQLKRWAQRWIDEP